MTERELLCQEILARLALVEPRPNLARNPVDVPSVDKMPACQMFEMDDVVEKGLGGGAKLAYQRRLKVVVESFITATSEGKATTELADFIKTVKAELYRGGNNLGGFCSQMTESGSSRILRPPAGEHLIGIGLTLDILYIEQISKNYE